MKETTCTIQNSMYGPVHSGPVLNMNKPGDTGPAFACLSDDEKTYLTSNFASTMT